MNEIWSIIGLSSLIAAVVTIALGIIKEVIVERYRFKRKSEAGYIQSQIQLYSRIYFVLKRLAGSRAEKLSEFFGEWEDEVKELHDIMKSKTDLLEQRVIDNWLEFWSLYWDHKRETDSERKKELAERAAKHILKADLSILDSMNNNLIPKYRKIVGETVPALE